MDDALEERVRALERTVTDGEYELTELTEEAAARERLDELDERAADLADRVAELEAATQALRGYVGNVRAVNRDVEQRADAALAKVESLEERVDTASHAPGQQSAEESPGTASADGGVVVGGGATERPPRAGERASESPCDVCGRVRGDDSGAESERPPTGPNPEADGETLVPETSETGALRRIKELL